jgi:hypothetical protein
MVFNNPRSCLISKEAGMMGISFEWKHTYNKKEPNVEERIK